ncbi:MAG: hypothetical protein DRQ56_10435, partial [Gammaproteobacteria bacterium]
KAEKIDRGVINVMSAFRNSFVIAKSLGIPWIKLFLGALTTGPAKMMILARSANASAALDLAIEEGDCEEGIHVVGQVQGRIKDTPTVAEVMARVIAEAKAVKSGFS